MMSHASLFELNKVASLPPQVLNVIPQKAQLAEKFVAIIANASRWKPVAFLPSPFNPIDIMRRDEPVLTMHPKTLPKNSLLKH